MLRSWARSCLAGGVFQGVFEDPAHPGGVGAQGRTDLRRQLAPDVVEILQHPGAGPVDVGAVFEDDVDQGEAVLGEAAHHLGLGHRQHGGGQGIGDLVFDDLRGLLGEFGADDHLDVGEVGDGVHRDVVGAVDAPGSDHQPHQEHHDSVAYAGFDYFGDHKAVFGFQLFNVCAPGAALEARRAPATGRISQCLCPGGMGAGAGVGALPCPAPGPLAAASIIWTASRKRDSESSRNWAEVTTSSPPLSPESTSR